MPKTWTEHISYGEVQIPLRVHLERRRSIRVAMGQDAVLLRIPAWLSLRSQQIEIQKAKEWALQTFDQKPALLARYDRRSYQDGDQITVRGRDWRISISERERRTGSGKVTMTGHLHLQLPLDLDPMQRDDMIRKLLSRSLAAYYKPEITSRIHELNRLHFQEEIKDIYLKYNRSNWGSCSTNRNINLSTRLLLVPDEVLDYVIIHELAHLKEMNHSKRFWAWVEQADPHWRDHTAWLEEQGSLCEF